MSNLLNFFVGLVLMVFLVGCSTVSDSRLAELDRIADQTMGRLVLERAGLQGELNASAGFVVAEIDRTVMPSGNPIPVNGVLVRTKDGARCFVKVSRIRFDGAEGAKKVTAVVILPDSSLVETAMNKGLEVGPPDGVGRVFVCADGKRFAVYHLKSARIKPVPRHSSDSSD